MVPGPVLGVAKETTVLEEGLKVNEVPIQLRNPMMTWMIIDREGTEEEREVDEVVSMIILPLITTGDRLIDQEGGEEEQEAEEVVLIVTMKITEGQVPRVVDQEGAEKIVVGLGEEWEAEEAVLMMSLIERVAEEEAEEDEAVSGNLTEEEEGEEEEEEETGMGRVMVKTQTLVISETVEELLRDSNVTDTIRIISFVEQRYSVFKWFIVHQL